MNEQDYVVLEVRPKRPVTRGAPTPIRGAGAPFTPRTVSEATVSVASFSAREVASARRDPGVAVAPLLPMRLVAPVARLDAGVPAGPGSAWGVEAVAAVGSPFTPA